MKEIQPNTDLNLVFRELLEKEIQNEELHGKTQINKKPVIFSSPLRNAIYGHTTLSLIINSITPIDFSIYADESSLGNRKTVIDPESKVVVIIENLMRVAVEIGCGIGCEQGNIYVYNKTYWEEINEEIFKYFLGEVAYKSGHNHIQARKRKLNESLCEHFFLLAPFYRNSKKGNVIKINMDNGTYHVNSTEGSKESSLMTPEMNDYFMYRLPFKYDPRATAPLFEKYLDRVLPDKDAQNILFEYCGYIFTSHLKLERILILYGSGSNGKSVFFEILNALLGEGNISHYSMDKLCDDTGYYRANLPGKLVNYASEFGGKMDLQIFKRMVSNEPIDARNPYGRPFTIREYGKFIFNTNKLPEVEHTDAFFRRPLIIPFKEKISTSEKDSSLSKKIIEFELSGVFNLILKGLDRLLEQNNFTTSNLVEEEMNIYRKESNSVNLFLEEEGYKPSINKRISVTELYTRYRQYCQESGVHHVSRTNFKKRVEGLGYTIRAISGRQVDVFCEQLDSVEVLSSGLDNDVLTLFKLNNNNS